jgi:ferrous iron transport protein A
MSSLIIGYTKNNIRIPLIFNPSFYIILLEASYLMSIKTLKELVPMEKGRIIKVGGQGEIRRRLLDMGVVNGAIVELLRIAPLGDPVQIKIKGYDLALRKKEAANIQVELTEMTLIRANPGEKVVIVGVGAGWGLKRRLADMGLTPGTEVRVINIQRPGRVVLDFRGSRLAIGYGVAAKIVVSPAGSF